MRALCTAGRVVRLEAWTQTRGHSKATVVKTLTTMLSTTVTRAEALWVPALHTALCTLGLRWSHAKPQREALITPPGKSKENRVWEG